MHEFRPLVSCVLNNSCFVSSGVRDRVVKAVQELTDSPTLFARGLAGGSRSIGLGLFPTSKTPFFVLKSIRRLEARSRHGRVDIIMADTG